MVSQLHLARISRQPCSLRGSDVQEHLIGRRRSHMHRSVAHFRFRPLGIRLSPGEVERALWWKARRALGNYRFQPLHGIFIRRSADVPCPVIVVIRKDAADCAVVLYSCRPIVLIPVFSAVALYLDQSLALILEAAKLLHFFRFQGLPALPGLFQFLP